jgi:NTE family protein
MNPKKALVLSGGSIKGAFQAGAIKASLAHGFEPDYIWGVSVGALNGAFLADRAGKATGSPNWKTIGNQLATFWEQKIKKPDDIVQQRTKTSIAWGTLRNRFKGFVKTDRLRTLLGKTVSVENIRKSPATFYAGVVNLADGRFFNADARLPDLVDYIMASTAIPVIMPFVEIEKAPLVDGGVRDIAPLRHAIAAGATEILVIACQPEQMEATTVKPNNLFSLVDRVTDIMTDEILRNDLEMAGFINTFTPEDGTPAMDGPFIGKRRVKITVVRPARSLAIDILDFDAKAIKELIETGEFAADFVLTHS